MPVARLPLESPTLWVWTSDRSFTVHRSEPIHGPHRNFISFSKDFLLLQDPVQDSTLQVTLWSLLSSPCISVWIGCVLSWGKGACHLALSPSTSKYWVFLEFCGPRRLVLVFICTPFTTGLCSLLWLTQLSQVPPFSSSQDVVDAPRLLLSPLVSLGLLPAGLALPSCPGSENLGANVFLFFNINIGWISGRRRHK